MKQQQTLMDLAPKYVTRDADGNASGYDWNGYYNAAMGSGNVDPNKIAEMRTQQATMQKTIAEAGTASLNLTAAHGKQSYEQMEGVRDLLTSGAPPAAIQFAYQNALVNAKSNGYDISQYPQNYYDLGKLVGSNDPVKGPQQALDMMEVAFGMHSQQLSDAQEKAKTSESTARAGLDNVKLDMIRNAKPGDFDAIIDAAAPPKGPNAALGARTKLLVNGAMGRGDYETAQKILEQMNIQIGAREREVMVQGQENYRHELDRQAAYLNADQNRGVQGLQTIFNDPRSGWGEFKSQYDYAKNLLLQAKTGNEVAAAIAPIALIQGQNSFAQSRRVVPAEVAAVGAETGSYYRRMENWFAKNGMGAVSADQMKDFGDILDGMRDAEYKKVETQAKYQMSMHNLDPNTTPVLDKNGNVTTYGGGAPTAPTPFTAQGGKVQKAAPVTRPTQPPTQAPAAVKVGQQVTLRNGKTVTVTAVHPNGTFDAK